MDILPFASSSDGNATWIKTNKTNILIDCGVSLKLVKTILGKEKLDALWITHEHTDHIKGAGPVARYYKIPIYIHPYSYNKKKQLLNKCQYITLTPMRPEIIHDLQITPFSTKHDCMYSLGFIIEQLPNGPKLCYLTDTGMITKLIKEKVKGCNIFFIESDYDEEKLAKYADYSDDLKDRIKSNVGHLSNTQVIEFIKTFNLDNIKKIIIGHLSLKTNSPAIIQTLLNKNFPDYLNKFVLAPLSKFITIT